MARLKRVTFLSGEITIPPWSEKAALRVARPIRQLQQGRKLSKLESWPMPGIGPRRHELRIRVDKAQWRIIYRTDKDSIVIAKVFKKKTNKTPKHIINTCKKRLARYDSGL